MPGKKNRVKVVLCAALTADGKLDAAAPVVPPVLYEQVIEPGRHPWRDLYDRAAGVLVDGVIAGELPMPQGAGRPVVAVHLTRGAAAAETRTELLAVLERWRREGATGDLLCFGGANLFRALLDAGAVDELRLIVRPHLDGRRGTGTLSGTEGTFFSASVACRLIHMEIVGNECFLHYRLARKAKLRRTNEKQGSGLLLG